METHKASQVVQRINLEPQIQQQMDFLPLNCLKITPNPNSHNSKTGMPLNFAAGLGGNGARRKIQLPHWSYDLKEGKSVISFSKDENDMLAETCNPTLIGKFTRIRPSF